MINDRFGKFRLGPEGQIRDAAIIDVVKLAHDIADVTGEPFRQVAQEIIVSAAGQASTFAKAFSPIRTGALRDSIKIEYTDGGLGATVFPTMPYAVYLEYGTGGRGEYPGSAYKIRPKRGQFLKFQVGGKTIYAKEVTHPGISPRPFMRPAAERVAAPLAGNLEQAAVSYIVRTPGANLKRSFA